VYVCAGEGETGKRRNVRRREAGDTTRQDGQKRIYTHTYIHTYIHTHIHTYIYMYTVVAKIHGKKGR